MELRKIDELVIGEHHNLQPDDECYYFMEYTAAAGFNHSTTNDLILNFKKSPARSQLPDYHYKGRAIKRIGQIFRDNLTVNTPPWILVPIPPSKVKANPLYDNRMTQALNYYCADQGDIRELIYTLNDRDSLHGSNNRRSIPDLQANMAIDKTVCAQLGDHIVLFDDVLTTGASFKACKNLILQEYPNTRVIGIFVARRSLLLSTLLDFEGLII